MIGSDPNDLLALASEFDTAAAELRSMLYTGHRDVALATLDARLRSIWHGHRAEAFAGNWRRVHAPRLRRLEHELTEAASAARRNAAEQMTASSVVRSCVLPRKVWAVEPVPPRAKNPTADSPDREIILSSTTDRVEVSASTDIVNVSEGGTTRISEVMTPGGTAYTVDLELDGAASYVILGVTGTASATAVFDTREEAEEFRDHIHAVLKPGLDDVAASLIPLALPVLKATETAWYAKDYADNMVSIRVDGGAIVETSEGTTFGDRRLSAEAAATAQAFTDLKTGETGLVFALSGAASAAWGGTRGTVKASAEAEFSRDADGETTHVTLTLDVEAQGTTDFGGSLVDNLGLDPTDLVNVELVGERATVTATFDVTDDEAWATAVAVAGGDFDTMPDLIDRSSVTVTVGAVETTDHFSPEISIPAPGHEIGLGGSYSTTNYTATHVLTKDPGGPITWTSVGG